MTGIAAADNDGSLPNLMGSDSQAPTPVLQTLNRLAGCIAGTVGKEGAAHISGQRTADAP